MSVRSVRPGRLFAVWALLLPMLAPAPALATLADEARLLPIQTRWLTRGARTLRLSPPPGLCLIDAESAMQDVRWLMSDVESVSSRSSQSMAIMMSCRAVQAMDAGHAFDAGVEPVAVVILQDDMPIPNLTREEGVATLRVMMERAAGQDRAAAPTADRFDQGLMLHGRIARTPERLPVTKASTDYLLFHMPTTGGVLGAITAGHADARIYSGVTVVDASKVQMTLLVPPRALAAGFDGRKVSIRIMDRIVADNP